jgi:hypothetical protein
MTEKIKLAHSFSALDMYEKCPQRYFRQRIVKDVRDLGSKASADGQRDHKSLELRLDDGRELPEHLSKVEPLCAKLESAPGELLVEQQLALNEDLKPVDWFDKDAWFRVMVDVLMINGDTAIVLDWKTGKRKIDYFQMESTAANLFMHYPEIQTIKTSLIWLKTMASDPEIYTKKEHFHSSWESIYQRVSLIEKSAESGDWPAKPSGLCNYCPAQTSCKYAKV